MANRLGTVARVLLAGCVSASALVVGAAESVSACTCDSTCVQVWYGTPSDRNYLVDSCTDTGPQHVNETGQLRITEFLYVGYHWGVGGPIPSGSG